MLNPKRFLSDETGATAIEYGLIAALICVALIAALQGLGTGLTGYMTNSFTTLAAAMR